MPWTAADAPKHNKGLHKSQHKKWASMATGIYKTCIADGGSDKTCAPQAIKIANSHFEKQGKRAK